MQEALLTKHQFIKSLLCEEVLAITETFLSPDTFNHELVHSIPIVCLGGISIDNYGVGVVVIVNGTISATCRQDLETDCEILRTFT